MGIHGPVEVEAGTLTIHLYPNLYVVFRRMRGAISSLFVSSATRKENKKGRRRENAKEPAFPRGAVLINHGHVWDRESNRM